MIYDLSIVLCDVAIAGGVVAAAYFAFLLFVRLTEEP